MDELNYHHLKYFWAVAKEGSLAAACERLQVAQPTISAQIKKLESDLQIELFRKAGRRLELTGEGKKVFDYADEIFSIGREMMDVLRGRVAGPATGVSIGLLPQFSQDLARRLISPTMNLAVPVSVSIRRNDLQSLLAELALGHVSLILTNVPLPGEMVVHVDRHFLGHSGIVLMCATGALEQYRRNFPKSLEQAPLVSPAPRTPLRRELDGWFESRRIRPLVVAECDDPALCQNLGIAGWGIFPVPLYAEAELRRQFGVQRIGILDGVAEEYQLLARSSRPLSQPARAILDHARQNVFNTSGEPAVQG